MLVCCILERVVLSAFPVGQSVFPQVPSFSNNPLIGAANARRHQMLKKVLIFVVLPLGLLTLAGYYWLGGFNEITVEVVEEDTRVVVGKAYRGKYGDLALRKIFVEAGQLQRAGTVPGVLTVINYDTLSASGQQINQFIGITQTAPLTTLPQGYQRDTIAAGSYLRAQVTARSLIRPSPGTVNERLVNYARQHQLSVSGLPIEFYRASDTLWVEMAIR